MTTTSKPTVVLNSSIIFEPGTTADGGNHGVSAINFNGYYLGSETRMYQYN